MILLTLASVAMGLQTRYGRQHQLAQQLQDFGAKIEHHPPLFGLPIAWASWLRDVESVDLSRTQANEDILKVLLRLPRLERLYLVRTPIGNEDLEIVGECRELRRLSLWGTQISNQGMKHLANLNELEIVDVHYTGVNEAALPELCQLPNLQKVITRFRLTDVGLKAIANLPPFDVETVKLYDVTDEGLAALQGLKGQGQIQWMEVTATDDALVEFLNTAGRLPFTRHLTLEGKDFTAQCLDAIPWSELKDVRFNNTQVTVRDIAERIGERIQFVFVRDDRIGLGDYVLGKEFGTARMPAPGLRIWLDGGDEWIDSAELMPNVRQSDWRREERSGNGVLAQMRAFPKLTHLVIEGHLWPSVTDEISALSRLEFLQINWCTQKLSHDVTPLQQLEQLAEIRFYCTPHTAEEIRPLGETRIRRMHLSGCRFPRSVLDAFPNAKHVTITSSHHE